MSRLRGLLCGAGVALTLGACGLAYDVGDLEGAPAPALSGDAAADVGDAGTDGGPPVTCPEGRGPAMVVAGDFCIDATEVTVGDYEAFMGQERALLPLAEPCAWVPSLKPLTWDEQVKRPKMPVVYVHYCHAVTYCAWAGKRLCGRVGGGAVLADDAGMDPSSNQWLRACTKGGIQDYPYGTAVSPGACPNRPLVAVGSRSVCDGPYPGLSDMLGNVGEWIDGCTENAAVRARDGCTVVGLEGLRGRASCHRVDSVSRNAEAADVGFRCCAP